MPRFKGYNQGQTVLLPVSFDRQILPGRWDVGDALGRVGNPRDGQFPGRS